MLQARHQQLYPGAACSLLDPASPRESAALSSCWADRRSDAQHCQCHHAMHLIVHTIKAHLAPPIWFWLWFGLAVHPHMFTCTWIVVCCNGCCTLTWTALELQTGQWKSPNEIQMAKNEKRCPTKMQSFSRCKITFEFQPAHLNQNAVLTSIIFHI